MASCISCKNRTSAERCTNRVLAGLSLCGKHSRMKNPRLWTVINQIDKKVNLISKVWKGYHLRKRIKLAGPGAVHRSKCINEEDIGSFDSLKQIDVFDYFGFEEDGKIYGFDVRTILDILTKNIKPTNPYTRNPIQIDDRKRLRDVYMYRLRNKLQITHNNDIRNKIPSTILNEKWIEVTQIIEENGFFNIEPNVFLSLNKTQLYVLLSFIHNDLKTWAAEHSNKRNTRSRRVLYVFWTHNVLKKFLQLYQIHEYSFFVSSILLSILRDCSEPYTVCFIIMSALYRL